MSETIEIGNPSITVHIRRSARARNYSLRISNTDGAVRLTVPDFAPLTEALDFARRQEGWLRVNLAKRPARMTPGFGQSVLFEGQTVPVLPGPGRAVRFSEGQLSVPGPESGVPARLRGFFKTRARDRLVPLSGKYSRALGQNMGRITLRDTRSRWGSCSSAGDLMYSWRLIMAPPAVLDYVAAHEVSHMVEMNHSPAFWAVVQRICPEYKIQRNWLRQNGKLLHSLDI